MCMMSAADPVKRNSVDTHCTFWQNILYLFQISTVTGALIDKWYCYQDYPSRSNNNDQIPLQVLLIQNLITIKYQKLNNIYIQV